jgi:F0F1-type ATP synthase assembly protein I
MASISSTRWRTAAVRLLPIAFAVVIVALILTRTYPVGAGLVAAAGLATVWLGVVATCLGFAVLTQQDDASDLRHRR